MPWFQPTFDASSWSPISVPIQNDIPGGSARFYRGTFEVSHVGEAVISFDSDDGIWVYVNGVFKGHWGGECCCFGSGGCVGNAPTCSGPRINLDISADLVAGTNVVAFEVDNSADGPSYFAAYFVSYAECVEDVDCDDGNSCNGLETCEPVLGCQSGPPPDVSEDRDVGDVAVVVVDGPSFENVVWNKPELKRLAGQFYCTHADQFDFLVFFSNFGQSGETPASFQLVMNADHARDETPLVTPRRVRNIGPVCNPEATDWNPTGGVEAYDQCNASEDYGSDNVLQGIVNMRELAQWPARPRQAVSFGADPERYAAAKISTLDALGHELLHRWGAFVRFQFAGETELRTELLGGEGHWNFLVHSEGSVLYGNRWRARNLGLFTTARPTRGYSSLDLYLMGLYAAEEVAPLFYVDAVPLTASCPLRVFPFEWVCDVFGCDLPCVRGSVLGTRVDLTIDDIMRATGGRRLPLPSESQRQFRLAFVVVGASGQVVPEDAILKVDKIRRLFKGWFRAKTKRQAMVTTSLQ